MRIGLNLCPTPPEVPVVAGGDSDSAIAIVVQLVDADRPPLPSITIRSDSLDAPVLAL
jgi:hypothetical protein